LEQLYRGSGPGWVGEGYARGKALYDPAAPLAGLRSGATGLLWRGKVFEAGGGALVNQWRGFRAIRAEVYDGPSWLDGKPSVIMDYGRTSRVWSDVRDEVREVAPGLFLGVMYQRRCPRPKLKLFFALEFCAQNGCRVYSREGPEASP
jgi:hypothetical protein